MTTKKLLTVQDLIDALAEYPADLPLIVNSYEDGYDPVTHVERVNIAQTQERQWYNGFYESAHQEGIPALLIASAYYKHEVDE